MRKSEIIDLLKSGKYRDEYEECQPIGASKEAVYKFASDVEQQCEGVAKRRKLENIFDIVNMFGGNIHTLSMSDYDCWDKMSGSIFIEKKKDFDVIIPEYTSPVRDKFTLAHELGHYLLHYLLHPETKAEGKFWAARMGSGRVEWEANWFAAAFLMPTYRLEQLEKEISASEISAIFGVSIEAAEYRRKTYHAAGI